MLPRQRKGTGQTPEPRDRGDRERAGLRALSDRSCDFSIWSPVHCKDHLAEREASK